MPFFIFEKTIQKKREEKDVIIYINR